MDYISTLIILFFGIFFGIITGLIPGVHINMISMFLLSNFFILSKIFEVNEIIVFIISMGIIHTFIDFIPSVLFGVPDSDTSLSILPAHKLVLNGEALKAIFLSSLGSFSGMIFAFFISPIFYFFLEDFYLFLKNIIPYFLGLVVVIFILFEKEKNQKFWAFIIVLFSSSLGLLILNSSLISNPLLVIFSGMFGFASIIFALKSKNKICKQNLKFNFRFSKNYLKGLIFGGVSSAICAIAPGIGNAQAASLSSIFLKKLDSEIFLFILGSINTINFILSFLTFYLIDRTRNGSVYVISQIVLEISFKELLFYFLIIFIVSIIGFFLSIYLGKILVKLVFKINFKIVNLIFLIFFFFFIFFLCNIFFFFS
ncbi:MAG: tripartite tricarboxylate transporter permease, partial [Nanoarchaeota archaeon]|nr:tripartite tricarboxylate transporter permease [Nanoarchaeota archaeon]